MSLISRISEFITTVATDIKNIKSTAIQDKNDLQTQINNVSASSSITVGPTPPANPVTNQLWIQTLN